MSYGLRVWNASGSLRLDTTDFIGRLIQTGQVYIYPYSAQSKTVNVSVPGMSNDGTWFVSALGSPVISINNGFFSMTNYNAQSRFFLDPYIFKYAVFRI